MDDYLKTLPQLGVGGIIAYIIFFFYKKQGVEYNAATKQSSDQHAVFLKEQLESARATNEVLINVIKDNTKSSTILSEVVRSLHEHLLFDHKIAERRMRSLPHVDEFAKDNNK